MKKVILAVLFAVSLAACTNSSTEGETKANDSTCVDSCDVVEVVADSMCCADSIQ